MEHQTSELEIIAHAFAKTAYESVNLVRRDTLEPHILHVENVVKILRDAGETDRAVICAALLHDVLEEVSPQNPNYTPMSIDQAFGGDIAQLVFEVTEIYTHENYTDIGHAQRKVLSRLRFASESEAAFKIKLADVIDISVQTVSYFKAGCLTKEIATVFLSDCESLVSALTPRALHSKDPVLKSLLHRAKTQVGFERSRLEGK